MTTETAPDPTQPRLLYPLIALLAFGLVVDMSFTNKLFPAPATEIQVELGGEPVLTDEGMERENQYRFGSALLLVEAAVALLWMLVSTRRSDPSRLTVGRSSLRLYAIAALSVPLVFLAVDMTRTHHFVPRPETTDQVIGQSTDENGNVVDVTQQVLNDIGQTEQRRDYFLGAVLLIGGLAAVGWAAREFANRSLFLVADDDGLLVRVDGPVRQARRISWDSILEVRSGLLEDDGIELPVLSLRFFDPAEVPYEPAGARAEPPWLHLFADEWELPPHQIAPFLDQRSGQPRLDLDYE